MATSNPPPPHCLDFDYGTKPSHLQIIYHQTPMVAHFTPYNLSNLLVDMGLALPSVWQQLTWLQFVNSYKPCSLKSGQVTGGNGVAPRHLQRCHRSLLYWLDSKLHHVHSRAVNTDWACLLLLLITPPFKSGHVAWGGGKGVALDSHFLETPSAGFNLDNV